MPVEIPRSVIEKLVGFSAAMIILPVVTFFLVASVTDNAIWSGGLAALVANIVLIGFVVMAFTEDIPVDKDKAE